MTEHAGQNGETARFRVSKPGHEVPAGAWDCHTHVFGPATAYPYAKGRSYTPPDALPEDAVAVMETLGIERFVLVQPSPYRADNRRLLDALDELGGRARGVVALEGSRPAADELRAWRGRGVRALRINQASGGAGARSPLEVIEEEARLAQALGWHVELHIEPQILPALASLTGRLGVDLVLDHFGKLQITDEGPPALQDELLRALDTGRVWITLSGAYRVAPPEQYRRGLARLVHTLVRANPERLIWASDWPHTPPHGKDADRSGQVQPFRPIDPASLLDLLFEWVPDPDLQARILCHNPAKLYG